jgi:predicted CXXCH cytochrome family protein
MGKITTIFLVAGLICLQSGCDPVTRYKITSTIFDGVPRMPPAEEYCREYHENALAEEAKAAKKKELERQKEEASSHPPYLEKRCNDCHDKSTDSGFITAKKDLCFACHTNFLKGAYFHGPAAAGACLKCHSPHDSHNPFLLTRPKSETCGVCHIEQRVAKGLHDNAKSRNLICLDCHDPHAANNKFFLR